MELNITEISPNNIDYMQSSFEKIPENTVPVKVIKKGVRFQDPQKPIHQVIPSENAKMTRPSIVQQKPKISYEDILSKMGMFVSQGKLHLLDENHDKDQQIQYLKQTQNMQKTQNLQQPPTQVQYDPSSNIPQNSYIYNKYFRDQIQEPDNVRKPLTLLDYRNMLIQNAIQKQRIKQIKSTKLMMPTTNINLAAGSSNLNKLFNFSKR